MVRVKDKLKQLDVRPSKERGQNFIIDPSVLHSIIDFGQPSANQHIVEIGPGLGALTSELARFGPLTLIEIEASFCQELRKRFPQAQVVQADARSVDFSALGAELTVFGNLPYSFSTEIIFHLIEGAASIRTAVLMLQREFAERLAAEPGGRDYGVLSVNAQMWADMELGPIIPGTSFHPPTQVQSRLIRLTFLKQPRVQLGDSKWFQRVLKGSFLQRRRKILNSLKGSGIAPEEVIVAGLQKAGVDPMRRAETLSLQEFVALAEAIKTGLDG